MLRASPWFLLALVALALLPLLLPNYWLFLLTSMLISSMVTLSVGLVSGMAGMISLGQLSFAGVGGWMVAYFNANNLPIPFVLQVLIGALVAVPLGIVIGLPALRVRGVHLAVVTFGFAAVADLFFTILNFPGGVMGKPVLRPDFLSHDRSYYWFCLFLFVLLVLGVNALYRSRLGSAWLAVKHSERAAAAMGLNVAATKLWAFAMSAFIAGLSGGLLAGQVGLLSATNFSPTASLILFASAIMVGARYPAGAVLAGVMAWLVPEVLGRLHLSQNLGNLIFALGTIAALKAGGGIFEVAARQKKPAATPPLPPPAAPAPAAHTPSDQVVLEVQNLCVAYGQVLALNKVSFSLKEGQVLGLIGPNGAGKSSLVDALSGFTPYQGRVQLEGRSLEGWSAAQRARAGLRRSFQQDRTIPELSVQAYLELSAGRALPKEELAWALEFAGLTELGLELHSLNMGTRRRLEVAGILLSRPKVVLLDEPAAGLSSEESLQLARQIAGIPARYGCSVILIEHDMEVVRAACSEVVVLDFGCLIEAGPTTRVLSSPRVAAAYLGEEVLA
ncbi:ABC transporter permease subunit [Meiothermus ruber]|jgi:branched-chain amino acid transport system permease protein|uniref:ABC transporter n=1 Tax=Meiothermus ruber (strain ATCC 35948 / DSM 1279 / VKM B-1258 / 21) TaxID=504728 RepID=D3PMI3_MEIRD|nr:ATP-binding cassette domain-containing protein [Meiothermus ruber]ADD29289.1 ABC transporter related protein [Meiothermus ruber DSM 1279]AGK05261.1 ABC transporter [Meiothermus ruber DSM 1279]MCL6529190.1 ATP-binding cassette domain-containing protein [Meiothermus ruber]GAO76211.1 ABC transporter [Meiothermus ruber H328]